MESIQGLFNEDLRRVAIVFWGHVIGLVKLCLHKAHEVYCNYSLVDHDVIDMPQHICLACIRHAYFFLSVCVLVRVVWTAFFAAELAAVCTLPPPPLAHARPCLSTGWALNRRFEEILGPLFLWSRMEDWVFVECLYRERGAQSCLCIVHCVHNNIVPRIATPCCLF